MSNIDDYVTGERGGIPWAQAAAFFVELKDVAVPEPVLTKAASAGLLKLAYIRKLAQTPEEAQAMQQEAAMTDPNVVEALDYQEMAAERAALQETVQGMQQQVMQATTAQQQAEQQVQEMTANTQALEGQLEQANAGRQQAIEQAVMAKDQALTEVVNQQQHREQIMQTADQLAMQLKQVASTSPNEAMAQQQQAAAEQQAAAGAAQQGGSAKAQQEAQQAQQAQVDSQIQSQQAQQAQQQDEAKAQAQAQPQGPGGPQPMAQATQEQQGAAGSEMPKQGSATLAEAAWKLSMQKLAYFYLKGEESTMPMPRRDVAYPEWDRKIAQKRREHFENFIAMAERKKGKALTKAEADVVINTYNKTTGEEIPLTKAWSHGSLPYEHFEKNAAKACPTTGESLRGPGKGPGRGRPHGTGPGLGRGPGKGRGRLALEKEAVIEKSAAPLGIAGRLAYAGGGAAIGGAHAAGEQYTHRKKFGKNRATNDEVDRRADVLAASVKARRDPTYVNKLRLSTAKYKADVEKADREHPGGAIARGAVKGAIIGGLGGGAVHSLGGRVKSLVKARRAATKAAETAAKAAK